MKDATVRLYVPALAPTLRLITNSLIIVGLTTASALTGCVPHPAGTLKDSNGQAFDPVAFFGGHTHSWGVIEGRSGAPTQSIATDSQGERLTENRLRMVQHLAFQDGTTQQRTWVLWRTGSNKFEATANDMVGTAVGEADGRIFHWKWILARSPGNAFMNVTMNQWMYRMDDGSVTIRTTVSKLGFIVAEVTEQFVRLDRG